MNAGKSVRPDPLSQGDLRGGRLIIRADASGSIGSGHIIRMLSLAGAWQSIGGKVVLVAAEITDPLVSRVRSLGVELARLSMMRGGAGDARSLVALSEGAIAVAIDGYCFDLEYQQMVHGRIPRLAVWDDVAGGRKFDCDVLVNQNAHASAEQYKHITPKTARLLLGPEYALLPPSFLSTSGKRGTNRPKNLLISLGGGDGTAAGLLVLSALTLCEHYNGAVTVLASGSDTQALRTAAEKLANKTEVIPVFVPDMANRMREADIGVISGGTTSWEALYSGLPCVIVAVADNQLANCQEIDRLGAASYAGALGCISPEQLARHIDRLASNSELRQKISFRARQTVDGFGARRIVDVLSETR